MRNPLLRINRSQLEKIIGEDPAAIRAFEELFKRSDVEGGPVGEAPEDDAPYSRENAEWVEAPLKGDVASNTTHRGSDGSDHSLSHTEAHSVASHDDTTATGAELEALTNDSMVDTLHRHSELSADDGSPDAVVSVDSDGILYADATPIGLDILRSALVGINLDVGQNIIVGGTVDGIDIAIDVGANTTHRGSDGKDHSDVEANNAKVTNATHTGEVTGSAGLTIADNIIDEANLKLDVNPTNGFILAADDTESGGMKWVDLSLENGGTVTPSVPTITVEGAYKGFLIRVSKQPLLSNFARYEFQVSADEVNAYSLEFDGSDWKDTLNEDTDFTDEWLFHTPLPPGGTEEVPLPLTLSYRVRRVTIDEVASDWTAWISAINELIGEGDISQASISTDKLVSQAVTATKIETDTITAAQVHTDTLSALFAKVVYALTIGYAGTGDVASPDEGDRRTYIDNDEIRIEEYTEGAWSTVKGIKIGGALAGIFLSAISCQWMLHPEVVLDNGANELFPGPGELFTLDNTYDNQYGEDTWHTHTFMGFQTNPKKFGTHSLTCIGAGDGDLVTASDMTIKKPQALSAWYYSGALDGAQNEVMKWTFGWDGASTTYTSNIRLLFIGTTGDVDLRWHDDYDDVSDSSLALATLSADTWHHIALIWDYDNDQVIVVVDRAVTVVNIYDFNELGLRDSEPPLGRFILDKDETTSLDDLSVVKDVLIDPDIYVQHYNHNVPWNGKYNAKDLFIKPATGGVVRVIDDLNVAGSLTIPGYKSGWIANSDWTNMALAVNHGLGVPLEDLIVKFFISANADGSTPHEILAATRLDVSASSGDSHEGMTIEGTDDDNIIIRSGNDGVACVWIKQADGLLRFLGADSFYYNVVIYHFSIGG